MNTKPRIRTATRGFTVLEMLVVTAIIMVITTVMLANNGKFGGRVILENVVYDIALSIRQAQQYGISQRKYNDTFTIRFGMHFDTTTSYELFADSNTSGTYEVGEEIPPSPYTIGRGYRISALCATPTSGTEACGHVELNIFFKRPEPDAWIGADTVPCTPSTGNGCYASARIELLSPRGDRMSAVVQANGQIAVQ